MASPVWTSHGAISVLGTGYALPGPPIGNEELFALAAPHAPALSQRAVMAVARRLGIQTRHISRGFSARSERPLAGRRNPELAARAVRQALDQAGLQPDDLGYIIGHTTTPALPLPPNVALVADALGYGGPFVELRQACTGFANALMIAFGLLAHPGAKPVAIVGSETGSLFFDPARAASRISWSTWSRWATARQRSSWGRVGLGRTLCIRPGSGQPVSGDHPACGLPKADPIAPR